jgi:hypothetical protein
MEIDMKTILKNLDKMNAEELLALSEAIDIELDRRQERLEKIPESARRRAVMRDQSYRRSTGAFAPPVRSIGLKKQRDRRDAA